MFHLVVCLACGDGIAFPEKRERGQYAFRFCVCTDTSARLAFGGEGARLLLRGQCAVVKVRNEDFLQILRARVGLGAYPDERYHTLLVTPESDAELVYKPPEQASKRE